MIIMVFALLASLWFWPAGIGAGVVVPPAPVGPPAPAAAPTGEVVRFPYFGVPSGSLYLCGQPVPLDDPLVKEDLDRELTIAAWSRAQTTLWLKRANRYLPEVDEKLRARRLPLDLRYVLIIESDLRPTARSSAGAQGLWQFMAPTAQRFQLKCNTAVDERLEFEAATDAALSYLQRLYGIFHNWALALAAYNCGEARVQKEMAVQGVNSFYHLALPEETERYVFRILAAKIIMENPARYGYEIPGDQLYPALQYDEVGVTLTQAAPVRRLAEACGTYYKAFKTLNPWIKGAELPPGVYRLKVPKGSASRFEEAYRRGQLGQGPGEPQNARGKREKGKTGKREKGQKQG